MISVWTYSLISVFIISAISLVGLITLSIDEKKLKKILIYMISFSAGALFGDAFLHLLPDLVSDGFSIKYSIGIIFGIISFFILEKVVCWRHCHMPITKTHVHSFAYMNLIGDFLHNFIDGLIIGASYLISIPAGIATTIAVFLHEVPQEIGDFGVLIYAGFSKTKAILMNFLVALSAVLGVIVVIISSNFVLGIEKMLSAIAIGGFLYIAGSDLIPELHKDSSVKVSIIQIVSFIVGVLIMFSLLFLE